EPGRVVAEHGRSQGWVNDRCQATCGVVGVGRRAWVLTNQHQRVGVARDLPVVVVGPSFDVAVVIGAGDPTPSRVVGVARRGAQRIRYSNQIVREVIRVQGGALAFDLFGQLQPALRPRVRG